MRGRQPLNPRKIQGAVSQGSFLTTAFPVGKNVLESTSHDENQAESSPIISGEYFMLPGIGERDQEPWSAQAISLLDKVKQLLLDKDLHTYKQQQPLAIELITAMRDRTGKKFV